MWTLPVYTCFLPPDSPTNTTHQGVVPAASDVTHDGVMSRAQWCANSTLSRHSLFSSTSLVIFLLWLRAIVSTVQQRRAVLFDDDDGCKYADQRVVGVGWGGVCVTGVAFYTPALSPVPCNTITHRWRQTSFRGEGSLKMQYEARRGSWDWEKAKDVYILFSGRVPVCMVCSPLLHSLSLSGVDRISCYMKDYLE